jgi:hypothetical protein
MSEWDEGGDVYYRIIADRNSAGGISSLKVSGQLQWFDEIGRDQARYYTENKFESEAEAQAFINEHLAIATNLMPMVLTKLGLDK